MPEKPEYFADSGAACKELEDAAGVVGRVASAFFEGMLADGASYTELSAVAHYLEECVAVAKSVVWLSASNTLRREKVRVIESTTQGEGTC